ncbi:light-harvesting complex-like protein OHP1, chloroplastic isoform X1 [Argentina anserina]|uniref:light-harvesting complex-like protein OHP1, chloroplastic isoform X1 n=1 Tax=Argentina anserina TaxID=57926 RepID=UPI002176341E|nr:light-harvesting complex-like protein OHP1, chloroplastic isoform X1 [Potentilla anserina]
MATSSSTILSSSFLPAGILTASHPTQKLCIFSNGTVHRTASTKRAAFSVRAAKLPPGVCSLLTLSVVVPKKEPKFEAPFLGFTRTAEIWNSRACMIGLIGTFIVELILNKGILQLIGVEIGKGLDLPL